MFPSKADTALVTWNFDIGSMEEAKQIFSHEAIWSSEGVCPKRGSQRSCEGDEPLRPPALMRVFCRDGKHHLSLEALEVLFESCALYTVFKSSQNKPHT